MERQAGARGLLSGLQDPPSLHPWLHVYYDAYLELSTDRQIGMAEGPIPWTSIARYAEIHNLPLDRLCTLLRAMDTGYIEHREKTRPKS